MDIPRTRTHTYTWSVVNIFLVEDFKMNIKNIADEKKCLKERTHYSQMNCVNGDKQ